MPNVEGPRKRRDGEGQVSADYHGHGGGDRDHFSGAAKCAIGLFFGHAERLLVKRIFALPPFP